MKKILPILGSLLSIAFVAFLVIDRTAIFRAGNYSLESETNIKVMVGAALVSLMWFVSAYLTESWKRVLAGGLGLTVLALAGVALSFRHPAMRHQVIRYELMQRSFGLSHYSNFSREEIHGELVHPKVGPYLFRDPELLRYLASDLGQNFQDRPREARVVYGGLLTDGPAIDDLTKSPGGQSFLSTLLEAEADTNPWLGLEHLPKPKTKPNPELGFQTGFFTPAQARQVVERVMASEDAADKERLLLFALSFPKLFEQQEIDEIVSTWELSLGERAFLANSGLRLRETLKSWLQGQDKVKVSIDFEPSDFLEEKDIKKLQTTEVLRRKTLALVRSCGPEVEVAEPENAELLISLVLNNALLYKYERPKYELKKVQVRAFRRGMMRHVTKGTAVANGTQTEYKWGAMLGVLARYGDQELSLGNNLVYWYDVIKAENQGQAKPPGWWTEAYNQNKGRTWPLGLRDRSFKSWQP